MPSTRRRLRELLALATLAALTACGTLIGFDDFTAPPPSEPTDATTAEGAPPGDGSSTAVADSSVADGAAAGDSQTSPLPCTSPFTGGSMLVLYGGRLGDVQPLDDVWTFDGTTWASQQQGPNQVTRHAMATRGAQAVSFGGTHLDEQPHDDTQRFFAGPRTWVASSPAQRPSHRAEAAMAPFGDELVLFGGTDGTAFGDTWLSAPTDGGDLTWNEAKNTGPGPRHAHAMATLPEAGTLLYGGRLQDSGFVEDTVVWDGLTWLKHAHFTTATDHPSRRAYHAMATLGCKVIMFGGLDESGPLGDTWEWDGRVSPSTWVRKAQGQAAPTPRYGHAMATLNGTVILFGGRDKSMHNSETWTWNGSRWDNVTNKLVGTPPPPRAHHGMAAYTQ